MPIAAPLLKKFLLHIGNPTDIELLINEAGLGSPPDPDAYRLARVLDHMSSGRKATADVRTALNDQKGFDNKILYGRQKDPSKLTGMVERLLERTPHGYWLILTFKSCHSP